MMRRYKNIVCLLLALSMSLALAACGGPSPAASVSNASVQENAAAATPTPADVYASEYKELITDSRDYFSVRAYGEDGLYYSRSEKVGENNPEGKTPDYEGQFDINQTFLYRLNPDGSSEKIENYASMPAPVGEEGMKDFSSGSDISGLCLTPDGFVTIEMTYASWNVGGDGLVPYSAEYFQSQRYEQKYYIRSFDASGLELSCGPIEVPADGWLEANRIQLDDKGNAIISAGDRLRAIAPDGQDAYEIESHGYIGSTIRLADGRIAVTVSDTEQQLFILDTESGKLVDGIPVSFDLYSAVSGTGEYDLYYTNGAYFYGYKLGDPEPTRLFSWLSCDVNSINVNVMDISDNVVTGIVSKYDEKTETYSLDRVTVRKVPYDSVPHKQTLTMAVLYLDSSMQDMVIDFNRHNDQYRIEVIDYSEYGNEKDGWDAGETKFKTEILSGKMPDIFSLSGMNYRQLAGKGLLTDLYPYIDADPTLKREDFFPNVLAALEVDGKLCSTVSSFYISSAIGAASVVGDEPGWTYDEFNAALSSMPEGCTAFDQYVTRDNILSLCLALDMTDFVNWNTGKVSFDSPAFIQLLEFANSFPSEFDWENYDWNSEERTEDRLAQGKQMLVQTSAFSIEDLFYNNYTQFLGGRITYVGYPTSHGTGNMISFSQDAGYAISSKSPNKDAAWSFLRTFFTRDYQSRNVYSLPSRLDVFEMNAEKAATVEYQKNADGNYLLDDSGERIPVVRGAMWNSEKQTTEEIYALSEEQIEQIRELILTTTKVADFDQEILDIVREQAAPYFAGQKSAEEVAKLVQSKANIYVNEQR